MKTGIYLHIPFCRSKCSYCSFVSRPWDESLADRYWRAVVRELEAGTAGATSLRREVDSIYFGGGTPSLVPAAHIAALLDACRRRFEVSPGCEISLEANPGTLEAGKLQTYRALGVNRISLGAQSFSDLELAAIGRVHTAAMIGESMKLLQASGIDNVSLDLILGLPGQTEIQWMSNLKSTIELNPKHISVYMLELEPKIPLYQRIKEGQHTVPEEDLLADWYLRTVEYLDGCGYRQYEISNFARPGCQCRHNLKYWLRQPVLAFGVGAHSYDGSSRYANVSDLIEYLQDVEEGGCALQWQESIGGEQDLQETLFLGLRLNRGLNWNQVSRKFAGFLPAGTEESLRELGRMGLVEWKGSRVRLTRRGRLLSNEVFQRFV